MDSAQATARFLAGVRSNWPLFVSTIDGYIVSDWQTIPLRRIELAREYRDTAPDDDEGFEFIANGPKA